MGTDHLLICNDFPTHFAVGDVVCGELDRHTAKGTCSAAQSHGQGGIVSWAVSCPNVPLSSSPHEPHSPPSPCHNTAGRHFLAHSLSSTSHSVMV